MRKLWGGVFKAGSSTLADAFGQSIESDIQFWQEDIAASVAHVHMLAKTGILKPNEAKKIEKGLERIHEEGPDALPKDGEDIHTAIEARLAELIGDVALKLHTGRSRNDQVATDARLYFHNNLLLILDEIKGLQSEIIRQAEAHQADLMPGYTHGQHAQPITLGYWMLAHFWPMQRNGWRLEKAGFISNFSPLGAAALAGTSLPIDRFQTSRELGFTAPIPSALDATSDRGWVLDGLHCLAQCMIDLSRLCQELALFSGHEFRFVRLGDALTTGSSIMPQKRNPDFAELIRGRTSEAVGHWVQVATMLKGLPLGYNRDTQDDKPPLFASMALVEDSVELVAQMVADANWDLDRMRAAVQGDFSTATDLADGIAMAGVPFRKAHEKVGQLVRALIDEGKVLEELDADTLKAYAPEVNRSVLERLQPEESVKARESYGGPGPKAMKEQLDHAKLLLKMRGFPQIV